MSKITFKHEGKILFETEDVLSTEVNNIQDTIEAFSLFLQLIKHNKKTVLKAMEKYIQEESDT